MIKKGKCGRLKDAKEERRVGKRGGWRENDGKRRTERTGAAKVEPIGWPRAETLVNVTSVISYHPRPIKSSFMGVTGRRYTPVAQELTPELAYWPRRRGLVPSKLPATKPPRNAAMPLNGCNSELTTRPDRLTAASAPAVTSALQLARKRENSRTGLPRGPRGRRGR